MSEYVVRSSAGAVETIVFPGADDGDAAVAEAIGAAVEAARRACAPCDDQIGEFLGSLSRSGIPFESRPGAPDGFRGELLKIPVS